MHTYIGASLQTTYDDSRGRESYDEIYNDENLTTKHTYNRCIHVGSLLTRMLRALAFSCYFAFYPTFPLHTSYITHNFVYPFKWCVEDLFLSIQLHRRISIRYYSNFVSSAVSHSTYKLQTLCECRGRFGQPKLLESASSIFHNTVSNQNHSGPGG